MQAKPSAVGVAFTAHQMLRHILKTVADIHETIVTTEYQGRLGKNLDSWCCAGQAGRGRLGSQNGKTSAIAPTLNTKEDLARNWISGAVQAKQEEARRREAEEARQRGDAMKKREEEAASRRCAQLLQMPCSTCTII